MEIVEARLEQAEGQLAYWREQAVAAGRQVAMWEGAVEALRGVVGAMREAQGSGGAVEEWDEGYGVDDVVRLKGEEQADEG